MQRADRTNRMYIHPVRQPHWALLTNPTRSSTLNPNTMSRNPKLKATERSRILPSRVHGARLNPNRAASYLQEPNPKPIRDKQIAEEHEKAEGKFRRGMGECGDLRGNPASSPLDRFASDRLGFGIRSAARSRKGEKECYALRRM
jgi:hypothetical protein